MIKIALTGSIGMGKSTVAAMFERMGVPVFDADSVVRSLQGRGGALVERIGERFPGTVHGGALDRERLAHVVLEDPQELAALEQIVHPAVLDARAAFIDKHRDAPALLFDIPLLFETGGETAFDKIVVVSTSSDVQRARVLKRPRMTEDKLDAIVARQTPDAEKRARADFVIDTSGELSTTEAQVRDILACLRIAAGE
jgi:dephospho-CoA kinase